MSNLQGKEFKLSNKNMQLYLNKELILQEIAAQIIYMCI